MLGGIGVLVGLALASRAIAEYGLARIGPHIVEGLLSKGKSGSTIAVEIESFPLISHDVRTKLLRLLPLPTSSGAAPATRSSPAWRSGSRLDELLSASKAIQHGFNSADAAAHGYSAKPAPVGFTLRSCPGCRLYIRLPIGRKGPVNCPGCGTKFIAST
jgi:hypothetical protein